MSAFSDTALADLAVRGSTNERLLAKELIEVRLGLQTSLRDHFAGLAMQGHCADSGLELDIVQGAKLAYRIADAMLAARGMTSEELSQ